MKTKIKKEKTSEPKFLNLHDSNKKNRESRLKWIKIINKNFRVLFRFRGEKRYNLIGAGTVFLGLIDCV